MTATEEGTQGKNEAVVAALKESLLFKGLPGEAAEFFISEANQETYEAGKTVVAEGTLGEHLFVIGSGWVEVVVGMGTRLEKQVGLLGPQNFFGEMCIIDNGRRSASVRTTQPCVLYSLSVAAIRRFLQEHPVEKPMMMLNVARALSRRLRQLDAVYASKAS